MTSHIKRSYKIQTWDDWVKADAVDEVTPAERRLMEACQAGETCTVGNGQRPDAPTPENEIGADLLRYLIIGGCSDTRCNLHDWGVDLEGAYISGPLDLRMATAKGLTGLRNCQFDAPVGAMQAKLEFLTLTGSHLPALNAEGAEVKGDVFLKGGFTAKGEVSLAGAQIGGQLECDGGTFENEGKHALNAQGAEVKGNVFLRGGFTAKGKVDLNSAQIGGQLSCTNGTFENAEGRALNAHSAEVKGSVFLRGGFTAKGEVSLASAQIGGQLECDGSTFENEGGHALNANNAQSNAFYWRNVSACEGTLLLTGAKTGDLVDDAESWEKISQAYLDGFEYKTIHGPLDEKMRLDWLSKATAYDGSFSPQPYEQLAWVLRRMGRASTARRVQLEKETKTAEDWRERSLARQAEVRAERDAKPHPKNHNELQTEANRLWWDLKIMPLWHWLLKALVGFGYAPQRAIWWTLGTIACFGLFYLLVWNFGGIVPNSDVILISDSWASALAAAPDHPAAHWLRTETGKHYESYFPWVHAADVFIPLINFGQEDAWTATTATTWGALAWVMAWGVKTFGWIVTALGAAAITGIIRRE